MRNIHRLKRAYFHIDRSINVRIEYSSVLNQTLKKKWELAGPVVDKPHV